MAVPQAVKQVVGTFKLGGLEFAMNISNIQEVVNFPEKITRVPLAPDYVMGIFNLRHMVIAVIDLAKLLGIAGAQTPRPTKVVIVDHEGVRVGLAFESTGEILRLDEQQRSDFEYHGDDSQQVVRGALKLNEGKRIIQLIDVFRVVSIKNLPYVRERNTGDAAKQNTVNVQKSARKQCISFRVADSLFAFEIEGVSEIINVPEIGNSAFQNDLCLGLASLRGTVMPIIDFARLLGLQTDGKAADGPKKVVVLRIGHEIFGLLIDAVESLVTCVGDEIIAVPVLSHERAQMFVGCIVKTGMPNVLLLDYRSILSSDELVSLTQGHSKIYQRNEQAQSGRNVAGLKSCYITFTLERLTAVAIEDIQEIIPYPVELIRAPGNPGPIKGLLNLRGTIVSIVDLRQVYGMPPLPEGMTPRVLVVNRAGSSYGLTVDSIEGIVFVDQAQKVAIPSALYDNGESEMGHDIQEVIECAGPHGNRGLTIFSIDSVIKRVSQSR